jgi:CRP-like cAMP-binding protein
MPDYRSQAAHHNDILSALPDEEYQRLFPNLRLVTLSLGQVIYETSERVDSIYFPTTSVLSLVYTTQSGSTTEIGVVGRDGMLGIALVLGGDTMPHRAVAQIAGHAFAVRPKVVENEFSRGAGLRQVLLRYTQALLTQISQTAVCNRLHSMEQRLCRWLLLVQERAQSDELRMTQEFISQMLGGRRESVTVAAGRLQDAGVIQYARGHIRIVDRPTLEKMACECYGVVRNECNRLRGTVQEMDRHNLIRA